MTDKLELKSSHEVVYTVYAADVESIFYCKPDDPDILTVLMKDGKRLYCDEVCPIEPVSERFAFKAIPRLLEMIEPTDRAKAYTAKLADTLEIEGYSTDAKIVRESLKMMNGEKVAMATMDEESVSEVWHDANAEQPEEYRTVVVWNPITMDGEVLTRCAEVYKGMIWSYIEDLLNLSNVERTVKEWKEPVSEELEEASKEWLRPQLDKSYANYGEGKMMELTRFDGYAMLDAIEFGANWQKTKDESTTEDLGEYINKLSKQFPEVSFAKLSRIAVRVAKWQKEQDQSTIELAEDHSMLAGMEKMKEEMMKEPKLYGYVARDEDGNLHIFEVEPRRLEEKHRWWDRDYSCHIIDNDAFPDLRWKDEPICVKLIIIKED